jgi:uroporphyrinogen III methyltransferase/synthase
LTKSRPVSVVITRSQEGNEELARRLRLAGLDPIPVDTISLAPPSDWSEVDRALLNLWSFDWLVFTSSAGAEYFGSRTKELSLELPWDGKPRVAAVGKQTAMALSRLGVKADFVPSSFTAATLGEELPSGEGGRVLLLRSDAANPALEERLVERGFIVEKASIYRTVPVKSGAPRIKGADLIVFASPSAVKSFCSLATKEELRRLKKLRAVCIGPVTESAARESGFANTITPPSFTIDEVVKEITRLSNEST